MRLTSVLLKGGIKPPGDLPGIKKLRHQFESSDGFAITWRDGVIRIAKDGEETAVPDSQVTQAWLAIEPGVPPLPKSVAAVKTPRAAGVVRDVFGMDPPIGNQCGHCLEHIPAGRKFCSRKCSNARRRK